MASLVKALIKKLPVPLRALAVWLYPPKHLTFEVTNVCNLRCPLCPSTEMSRKPGFASFEDFKKTIDNAPKSIKNISFYLLGEPLLNKNLFKMVKYAEGKGIRTTFSTNGMLLGEHLDDIFDSNLSSIQVTLDGLNKEDHESYRIGSDFDKCLNNIKALVNKKKEHDRSKPGISMQSLLFKHNVGKEKEFEELAASIGIEKFRLKKITLGRTQEKIDKYAEKFMPREKELNRSKDNDQVKLYNEMPICPQISGSCFILSNGDMVPCCFDPHGEAIMGNAFNGNDLKSLWYSRTRYRIIKQIMRGNLPICKVCDGALELS